MTLKIALAIASKPVRLPNAIVAKRVGFILCVSCFACCIASGFVPGLGEAALFAQDENDEFSEDPPSGVPHTVCHGKRIRSIKVLGARRIDTDDVLATIQTKKRAICDDAQIAKDARALWRMGFFEDLSFEAIAKDNTVALVIKVKERPAIRKVLYEGNSEVDTDDIDEALSLEEGTILSVPAVQDEVDKIRGLYAEEGFFLARISYEFRKVKSDVNQVDVVYMIDEGPETKVRRIEIVGNAKIKDAELQKIVQTGETNALSFISSSNKFNRDIFDEDVNRIQAWYYDKGYLTMRMGRPRVELTPDREYVDLSIPVEEGERYRIGDIEVQETDDAGEEVKPLKPARKLRKEIKLKRGDWFSRTKIAEGIEEITRVYRDKGYAYVDIQPGTDIDPAARTVDVSINIRRGPPVYIERIMIRGNTKTRDRVIRREFRISEGELYNQTKIERAKQLINALGYFERVDLSEQRGSAPDHMIINVEVAERATGQFQVGAGFSSLESFVLTAQVQQQNLLGRGQTLGLNIQLSGIRQQFQVQFVEPWFLGSEWSLGLNVFKTIQEFSFFREDSTGGGITVGHPIVDPRLRIFGQYQIENVKITDPQGSFLGTGGDLQNTNAPLFIANAFRDGLTSSFTLSLSWDNRNNRILPTNGQFVSYSVQFADPVLGSDNTFVRQTAFMRFYKEIFGPFVFKMNTEVGLITSRDREGVPVFEKFYLGGIFNIRGYPLQSIGPQGQIGLRDEPDSFVDRPLGGNFQAFYNIELEFPIVKQIGIRGVLFHDGGNAWNFDFRDPTGVCQIPATDENDSAEQPCGLHPNIRMSWGFGIRWFSPLGPLRFEWGLPIRRRQGDEKIRFEFTIGNSF